MGPGILINDWEARQDGYYDIKYVGTNKYCSWKNFILENYPDYALRNILQTGMSNNLFCKSQEVMLHIYYNGSAWKVEYCNDNDASAYYNVTWDSSNLLLNAPLNYVGDIALSQRYIPSVGVAYRPVLYTTVPVKIYFADNTCTLVTTPEKK